MKKTKQQMIANYSSFAEDTIVESLGKAFPRYSVQRNARFSWLLSIRGNPLELDIFIPKINLAIEIQGPQHFKRIFGNKKQHVNLKCNDLRKKQKCREMGIQLIWMDYKGVFRNFNRTSEDQRARIIKKVISDFRKSKSFFMFWKDTDDFMFE